MFSKRTALLLFSVTVLLTLLAAQCGAQPTPETITVVETVVVEKEVQGETVTVVETVVVEKEVEKVVEKEVEKIVEVEVEAGALPRESTLYWNFGAGDVPTLDPSLATDTSSIQVGIELFVGLTRLDEVTGAVAPGMATDWEVSDDGLVYTFHLRDDVPWVFYNNVTGQVEQVLDDAGEPRMVNANDFVYGIKRTLDPATGSSYSYVNWLIENAGPVNGENGEDDPLFGQVDEIAVEAVDDFTLQITLNQAASFFPSIASMWINWPQPQWLIEEKGDRWIEAGIMQSYGPYALKEWVHDSEMVIIANPFWPGTDAVPQPSIQFVHFDMLDSSPAFANYEAGLLDRAGVPLPELDRVKADPTLSQELSIGGIRCTYYYGFNVTKPPFDDVNVRKAFSWALDRTALVENVTKGGQEPARWFSRPGLTAAPDPAQGDDFGPPVTADVAMAQDFLAASSYGGPENLPEINLMVNQVEGHIRIAEAIQQMWKENLGVENVNLSVQEWKVFLQTLTEDPPQVFRLGWCDDYPDASNFARDVFRSDSGNNHTEWINETFDELVDQAAFETDLATRHDLYVEAERILVEEDAAIIPIYWYTAVEVTKPYISRTYGKGGQQAFEKWSINASMLP
ncbi:MAG: peptide ABC transporter substrate-binding protein [Anaerolineae bacterium]